jgi:GDP/UDP-N,N'-diacetylbacillosamine 2-epimerase (hydrolysing)
MKIAILTSSRADFGIYLPLLKKLHSESSFDLELIIFGTHLSLFYGGTIKEINKHGFKVAHTVESMLLTDSEDAIASAIGLTIIKFSEIWKKSGRSYDVVFCLGDRYEMFAAVTAGIPYQVPFAHLHGGENTTGAIDNKFRHSITLASKWHFTSTESHKHRVKQITGTVDNVYNVGALSLDNLREISLYTVEGFAEKWGVDFSKKTILTTFHPETAGESKDEFYGDELVKAIQELSENYQFLITMPNADTLGNQIRQKLTAAFSGNTAVKMIENLGSESYFSAMHHCSFLLGNTSSGIIEAASFGKYVINIGNRQEGREVGCNVITVPLQSDRIIVAARTIEKAPHLSNTNIYYNGGATDKIIAILKEITDKQ